MRVLMVHPHDIFFDREPWTRRITSLALELSRADHEVKLVYFPSRRNPRDPAGAPVVPYERVPLPRVDSPVVLFKNTRVIAALSRWADVVHIQKAHPHAAIPAAWGAYLNGKPLHYDWDDGEEMIWYESCGRSLHASWIGLLFGVMETAMVRLADTISVSSRALRDRTLARGVRPQDILFLPVSVDTNDFHPGTEGLSSFDVAAVRRRHGIDGPLVLYVGQLGGVQHVDLLVEAAARVLHENGDVFFLLVGDGDRRSDLERIVARLGLGRRVVFAGAMPAQSIPGYIAAADICVAPFRDTPAVRCKSPLKIMEYMSAGKAIVAGRVGEVAGMIGASGVLVEPGDAGALADGLIALLRDASLRQRLGEDARRRVQAAGGWSSAARNLAGMYERASVTR